MNAKDKMSIQRDILKKFPGTDPETDIDWDIAEISFKAGQKEVMEWFENNRGASYQGGFLVNGQLWQSQLKEWEIEK